MGKIATVMGRLYAMDRDNAWERIEQAYDAMVFGQGIQASDPVQAIKDSYQVVDETGKHPDRRVRAAHRHRQRRRGQGQ